MAAAEPLEAAASPARPALTEDRIVTAAIDLIEREGVDALSMRRVAAELGVAAMSLYYHVPNKAALLDGVAERIVTGLDLADDPALPAADRARRLMRTFRRVAHDHPRCVQLILTRSANSPASLRLVEQTLTIARAAGFEGLRAARITQTFLSYAIGSLVREAGAARALKNLPAGVDLNRWLGHLDPAVYPSLVSLSEHDLTFDPEAEFEYGLELLLHGLQQVLPPER